VLIKAKELEKERRKKHKLDIISYLEGYVIEEKVVKNSKIHHTFEKNINQNMNTEEILFAKIVKIVFF